jgi:hypothetical protein
MARPKGRPLPAEHRENIRKRRRWVTAFVPIRDAAESGDRRKAIRLLDEYVRNNKPEEAA